jgi:hypothetical protein
MHVFIQNTTTQRAQNSYHHIPTTSQYLEYTTTRKKVSSMKVIIQVQTAFPCCRKNHHCIKKKKVRIRVCVLQRGARNRHCRALAAQMKSMIMATHGESSTRGEKTATKGKERLGTFSLICFRGGFPALQVRPVVSFETWPLLASQF